MDNQDIIEPFLIRLKARIDSDPGLTAAGLSLKAGLSNAAIRQWFSRSTSSPTLESARKVCAALGTTLEEFMSDAQTEEERQIVRLIIQLPDDLRRQLLGYGEALADLHHRQQSEEGSDSE
jgi:transcriptional regulator with XRE-family HTH domain